MRIEKLKKDEIIERYKNLQEKYEELKQQNKDLEEYCDELEKSLDELQEGTEESTARLTERYDSRYDELLKELRFSSQLQDEFNKKLFPIYKDYFIDLCNLYCIDLPDEVYNAEYRKCKIDNMVYETLEKIIREFEFSEDLREDLREVKKN